MTVPPPPASVPDSGLLGGGLPLDDPESPPSGSSPPQPGSAQAPAAGDLVARLRLLNVYVQQLWARLDLVRGGAASLESSAGLIAQTAAQIQPLVDGLEAGSATAQGQADSLARITCAWRAIAASPILGAPGAAPLDAQGQLKEIALLETECRTAIYWTAYLTSTHRLKEWLRALRPGYALLFHDIFKDEVPFIEERQRLLGALASAPQLLAETGGLIDGDTGVVYRYEVEARKRWGAVLGVALALAVATAAVAAAGLSGLLPGGAGAATVTLGWLAALVGLVVHLGVTTAKRLRAGGAGAVALPVDRFSIDVSAKLGLILLRVGMLLVAYLGLLAGGLIAPAGAALSGFLFSALLTGYSLDSMIDLLSARLDQQAAAQIDGLKSQLGK